MEQRVPNMIERALIELTVAATEHSSNAAILAALRRVAGVDLEDYLKNTYPVLF